MHSPVFHTQPLPHSQALELEHFAVLCPPSGHDLLLAACRGLLACLLLWLLLPGGRQCQHCLICLLATVLRG